MLSKEETWGEKKKKQITVEDCEGFLNCCRQGFVFGMTQRAEPACPQAAGEAGDNRERHRGLRTSCELDTPSLSRLQSVIARSAQEDLWACAFLFLSAAEIPH